MTASASACGVVVIGRNEGDRLRLCLDSVLRQHPSAIVYVDSGSRDGSVALARGLGVATIDLDSAIPFTAARARNAGCRWMIEQHPHLRYIQFIDGDCELVPGWLEAAVAALTARPTLAAVCGRRRERFPDASAYNRLCDREWDTPVGLAPTCGGDALVRVAAFQSVGGFDPSLIAGEEPEFCHRMRQKGWLIVRVDREMTVHDAAMTRLGQWWQRNRRNGYATAEAFAMRGRGDPRLRRQLFSNLLWALPLSWPLWPLLWLRVLWRGGPLFATYITLGKLPHAQGQVDYWRSRRRLIEYK